MGENNKDSSVEDLKLMFSCSGAADTAELGDRAARKVHRSGEAKMYCLAGVGGDVDMIVNNTRDADRLVVIDGCDTDCAAKLLRKSGFPDFEHFRVTDLGFEKGQSPVTEESVERVAAVLVSRLRVGEA